MTSHQDTCDERFHHPGFIFFCLGRILLLNVLSALVKKKTETMIGFGSCSCFLLWLKRRVNCIVAAQKKAAEHHPAHRKTENNVVGQFTVLRASRKPLLDNLLYREQRANQDASF